MRRLYGTILLVLGLALLASACSSKSATPTNTPTSGGTSTSSAAPTGGATTATIVAQNFAFSPNSVNVSAGTVTLTVTNKDSAQHTFTLDDGSSSTDLPPGGTQTITLDLTATVGWHCNIHPSMTGTLNVG